MDIESRKARNEENVMDENRSEQMEALGTLCQVNDRLLRNLPTIIGELSGDRQPDTDKYLTNIVDTINWEITVMNATSDLLAESGEAVDKEDFNRSIQALSAALSSKEDSKIARALQDMMPQFELLGGAIKKIVV